MAQIRDFFPIEIQGKLYSIAGLPLPNSDFTGCDEEKVANALSHVCTILLFLSDLFQVRTTISAASLTPRQVPLRYPIILLGSRSSIRDDLSNQASNKFPLYSRGVDRTRFEYGVFLLNKDLEQVRCVSCVHARVPTSYLADECARHRSGGSEAHAAESADAAAVAVPFRVRCLRVGFSGLLTADAALSSNAIARRRTSRQQRSSTTCAKSLTLRCSKRS